jgi:hypothetical protein
VTFVVSIISPQCLHFAQSATSLGTGPDKSVAEAVDGALSSEIAHRFRRTRVDRTSTTSLSLLRRPSDIMKRLRLVRVRDHSVQTRRVVVADFLESRAQPGLIDGDAAPEIQKYLRRCRTAVGIPPLSERDDLRIRERAGHRTPSEPRTA